LRDKSDKNLFVTSFFFSSIDESRPFTIDAMLNNTNNNGKNLNKENSHQRGMLDRDY
jgi:hypothetical protein